MNRPLERSLFCKPVVAFFNGSLQRCLISEATKSLVCYFLQYGKSPSMLTAVFQWKFMFISKIITSNSSILVLRKALLGLLKSLIRSSNILN